MDVASMAHGLEVRSPLLDHRVIELAASLPPEMKLAGLVQKVILRRIARDVLPRPILRRKKMGFGVPIDRWLRVELREMARDVLLDGRARQRGLLRADEVRRLLDEHQRGVAHHHPQLWALLVLELWYRELVDGVSAPATAQGVDRDCA
jgi:asparagine synthase (glutamine-hydrolysing)